jgi:hypothetical protein
VAEVNGHAWKMEVNASVDFSFRVVKVGRDLFGQQYAEIESAGVTMRCPVGEDCIVNMPFRSTQSGANMGQD